jgi:hypothetical protein
MFDALCTDPAENLEKAAEITAITIAARREGQSA